MTPPRPASAEAPGHRIGNLRPARKLDYPGHPTRKLVHLGHPARKLVHPGHPARKLVQLGHPARKLVHLGRRTRKLVHLGRTARKLVRDAASPMLAPFRAGIRPRSICSQAHSQPLPSGPLYPRGPGCSRFQVSRVAAGPSPTATRRPPKALARQCLSTAFPHTTGPADILLTLTPSDRGRSHNWPPPPSTANSAPVVYVDDLRDEPSPAWSPARLRRGTQRAERLRILRGQARPRRRGTDRTDPGRRRSASPATPRPDHRAHRGHRPGPRRPGDSRVRCQPADHRPPTGPAIRYGTFPRHSRPTGRTEKPTGRTHLAAMLNWPPPAPATPSWSASGPAEPRTRFADALRGH